MRESAREADESSDGNLWRLPWLRGTEILGAARAGTRRPGATRSVPEEPRGANGSQGTAELAA